ncbi:MAG: RNA polymerase sigma factor [Solirubrobacteraceae bacterium]
MTPEELDAVAGAYEAYSAQVHAYALRRSDRETADEVTARVFLVAARRRRSLPADPLPWLYGVARRVLAEERRSQRRRQGLHGRLRSMTVEDTTELALPDQALARALCSLSAADREALLLCYWEELDLGQIARVMGCTRAAASVRLHRARGRLRRALESEGHERACAVGADS